MKKILGYGYYLTSESVSEVLTNYYTGPNRTLDLHKTTKEVRDAIKLDKKLGLIGSRSKPKLFRIIVEEA